MNKRHLLNFIIILIIGITAYANSFGNQFVWDDRALILQNPYITSLKNIGGLFYREFFPHGETFNYYRPITAILYTVDHSIWKLNPFGYHLTNFILHFIAACLVYAVLFYLFRGYLAALLLSLIFMAHPSATEAITYIPSRSEPLSLIFLIASFLFYDLCLKKRAKKICYIFSVLAFALACLSKEGSVVFPAFLFLYAMITGRGPSNFFKRVAVIVPYCLIALAYLILRYFVLRNASASFFLESEVGFAARICTAPALILKYAAIFFFPRTFIMQQPAAVYSSILNPHALIPAVLLLAALGLIIKFNRPNTRTGAIWFLIFVFPVSGILPINAFFYHHWLYIPALGLLIILADLSSAAGRIFKRLMTAAAIIMIFACIFLTIKQNLLYKDEITLYGETIKKYPACADAHYNLGVAYSEKGRTEEAILEFQKAVEYDPGNVKAYINLGHSYQMKNLTDRAEELFRKAAAIKPGSYAPYYYLANLYVDTGRIPESIELYKKALTLKRYNPNIHFELARAYEKLGQIDMAKDEYEQTLAIEPHYAKAYASLANMYQQSGRSDAAIDNYYKALSMNPSLIDAYVNLGAVYERLGKYEPAAEMYRRGLAVHPASAELHYNLGIIYKKQKLYDDAISEYQVAIGLKPDYADAYGNLGVAYAKKGLMEKARHAIEKSLQLDPGNETMKKNLEKLNK